MSSSSQRVLHPSFLRILAVAPCGGFAVCVFYLLPKYLAVDLHATPAQIGLVGSVYGFASLLAIPIIAIRADRSTPRDLVMAGTAILGLAALGYLWVDRVGPLLLLLRLLQGVAWGVVFTAGMTLTIAVSPKERLAKAIGYWGSAGLAMNAVAPALGETIAERFGFTPVFLLAAAAGALGIWVGARLPAITENTKGTSVGVWSLMARPRSIWMMIVGTLWGTAFGAMFIFYQPFALELGVKQVKGFFVAYTAAALFARLGTGNLADQLGRDRVAVGSFVLYAGTVMGMHELRPEWLDAMGALFGFAHGLFFPAYSALVVERVAEEERSMVLALSNGVFNAGFAVGSLVLGMIAEAYGYRRMYAVAGASGFVVVALLLWDMRSKSAESAPVGPREVRDSDEPEEGTVA